MEMMTQAPRYPRCRTEFSARPKHQTIRHVQGRVTDSSLTSGTNGHTKDRLCVEEVSREGPTLTFGLPSPEKG